MLEILFEYKIPKLAALLSTLRLTKVRLVD